MKTNSGDSILEICVWNRGFHGAAPTLDGVFEEADMVRRIWERRLLALEAILIFVLLNCLAIEVSCGLFSKIRCEVAMRYVNTYPTC